jgi:membrane protein required for colicin V production
VTALSNVTLVKDNLEKYVNDSMLYPYLKEAGSYLINLDTSAMGLTVSNSTEVVKEVNASVDLNTSLKETNTSAVQ